MTEKKIGLIGTGIMGAPMAQNLLRAGYATWIHSRTKSKAQGLIENGAHWCQTPAVVAASASVIISIVSDSPDVEAVYLAKDGLCSAVKPGTLCIDMSTISPESTNKVACGLSDQGASFLDAPVSGGKTGAEAGTLSIMVGGTEADVARAAPIFEVLGKSTVHCGPIGSGQLTKLCNQILCGLNLLGVSEAIVFAKKVGLDPSTMLKAVSGGAAGSWAVDNLGPRMVQRNFAPMFMINLQQKDLRIALDTARRNVTPLPGTALVHQLLAINEAHNEQREGTQALVKTLELMGALNEALL